MHIDYNPFTAENTPVHTEKIGFITTGCHDPIKIDCIDVMTLFRHVSEAAKRVEGAGPDERAAIRANLAQLAQFLGDSYNDHLPHCGAGEG